MQMTNIKADFLESGTGDRRMGLKLADGTLKRDSVHLTEDSVKAVCKKIVNSMYYLPKSWFE